LVGGSPAYHHRPGHSITAIEGRQVIGVDHSKQSDENTRSHVPLTGLVPFASHNGSEMIDDLDCC
jgi:hypothetical protein